MWMLVSNPALLWPRYLCTTLLSKTSRQVHLHSVLSTVCETVPGSRCLQVTQVCFLYSQVSGTTSDTVLKSPSWPRKHLKAGDSTSFSGQWGWELRVATALEGLYPKAIHPKTPLAERAETWTRWRPSEWGVWGDEMGAEGHWPLRGWASGWWGRGGAAKCGPFCFAAKTGLAMQMNDLSNVSFDLFTRQTQLFCLLQSVLSWLVAAGWWAGSLPMWLFFSHQIYSGMLRDPWWS